MDVIIKRVAIGLRDGDILIPLYDGDSGAPPPNQPPDQQSPEDQEPGEPNPP